MKTRCVSVTCRFTGKADKANGTDVIICSSAGYLAQCLISSRIVIQKELIVTGLLSPKGRVLVTYRGPCLSHYLFNDLFIKFISDQGG